MQRVEFIDAEVPAIGPDTIVQSVAKSTPPRVSFESLRRNMEQHAEQLARYETTKTMAKSIADRQHCYLMIAGMQLELDHETAAELVASAADRAGSEAARLGAVLQDLVRQLP